LNFWVKSICILRNTCKVLAKHWLSSYYSIWGFYLGLQPNLNPLLILSKVDIVLSIRLLCSLPPIVCVIVYNVVCQVTVLPSSNNFSIIYSALYFLSPVVLSVVYTFSSIVYSLLYYFSPTVFVRGTLRDSHSIS